VIRRDHGSMQLSLGGIWTILRDQIRIAERPGRIQSNDSGKHKRATQRAGLIPLPRQVLLLGLVPVPLLVIPRSRLSRSVPASTG